VVVAITKLGGERARGLIVLLIDSVMSLRIILMLLALMENRKRMCTVKSDSEKKLSN
jgi:hypothetical protein